jgi:hypothetical protein
MKPDLLSACTTAAAISANVHSDKRYQKAYENSKEGIEGFPGIWTLIAEVAIEIEKRELEWGGEFEWIEFCDAAADEILKDLLGPVEAKSETIVNKTMERERARLLKEKS